MPKIPTSPKYEVLGIPPTYRREYIGLKRSLGTFLVCDGLSVPRKHERRQQ